jgi:phage-related protein
MTETFNYDRQAGASGKITYRVREVKFGDGYAQVVADGINNEVQSWPLLFEGTLAQMTPIRDFFRRQLGYKSFYWTPPGESAPLLFRADEVTFTSVGAGVYQISAEFKQVYYP